MKYATSVVFILMLCAGVASAEVTLSLQGPSSPVAVGGQFDVDVNITGVSDLFAFQFDIGFDPAFASALLVTEGPFLGAGGATFFIPGAIDNIGGSVTFTAGTLTGMGPGVTGNGMLARLRFRALTEGAGNFSLLSPSLYNSTVLDPITVTTQGTSVAAEASTAVPEPAAVLLLAGVLGALGVARGRRR